MDQTVEKLTGNRKRLATIQGASTGVGGIFTLTIDIPLLLGIQLKTLQDIAICYGYDPNDKKERLFIVKCLQFVSADIVGKQAILNQLSRFDDHDETTKRKSCLNYKAGVKSFLLIEISWVGKNFFK